MHAIHLHSFSLPRALCVLFILIAVQDNDDYAYPIVCVCSCAYDFVYRNMAVAMADCERVLAFGPFRRLRARTDDQRVGVLIAIVLLVMAYIIRAAISSA